MKILALRRADTCVACASALAAGTNAAWDPATKTVRCLPCQESTTSAIPLPVADPPPIPTARGTLTPAAGASAQLEFQRRSERRADAVRSRHPRLGGLILALTDDPASTRVWAQGAHGERVVAARLDELAGEHLVALHDRRMLRPDGRASRANIDHLAVCASGVWVVDAKTHKGTLQVRRSGGLFGPRSEELFIAGRDQTSLLDGLNRQIDAVRGVLAEVQADVPVRGALCFVGTELPWFGETIAGIPLVGRRALGKLMRQPGDLQLADRAALAEYLGRRFVPA